MSLTMRFQETPGSEMVTNVIACSPAQGDRPHWHHSHPPCRTIIIYLPAFKLPENAYHRRQAFLGGKKPVPLFRETKTQTQELKVHNASEGRAGANAAENQAVIRDGTVTYADEDHRDHLEHCIHSWTSDILLFGGDRWHMCSCRHDTDRELDWSNQEHVEQVDDGASLDHSKILLGAIIAMAYKATERRSVPLRERMPNSALRARSAHRRRVSDLSEVGLSARSGKISRSCVALANSLRPDVFPAAPYQRPVSPTVLLPVSTMSTNSRSGDFFFF